ncbi:MAG: hypothetical protein JW940_39465 [Polyangiaceae bacterium]|nr:hypothetical protein [Polyangiaceae bacterium]
MAFAAPTDRIRELNERAVRLLIEEHAARTDEPLILAVQYALDDPTNIGLLEVLDDFPGGDDDDLLITEFEPSASLRILGKLRLALASPGQLQSAAQRGDSELERARTGVVVYESSDPRVASLRATLGL